MASERWLSIKVELLSGRGLELERRPGRVMIASPKHTLAELAEAIDLAFTRRDHSHLHEFQLGDGKRYMLGGSDFEPDVIDSTSASLAAIGLDRGATFEYVYDLGDDWRHRCEVQATDVDPEEEYGAPADQPVPIWLGLDPRPVQPRSRRRLARKPLTAAGRRSVGARGRCRLRRSKRRRRAAVAA